MRRGAEVRYHVRCGAVRRASSAARRLQGAVRCDVAVLCGAARRGMVQGGWLGGAVRCGVAKWCGAAQCGKMTRCCVRCGVACPYKAYIRPYNAL